MIALLTWKSTGRTNHTPADGWRARIRGFRQRAARLLTVGRFSGALALTIAIWGVELATYALVARAAHVRLPLPGIVCAILLTNTGLVLRATPGNIGPVTLAALALKPRMLRRPIETPVAA